MKSEENRLSIFLLLIFEKLFWENVFIILYILANIFKLIMSLVDILSIRIYYINEKFEKIICKKFEI